MQTNTSNLPNLINKETTEENTPESNHYIYILSGEEAIGKYKNYGVLSDVNSRLRGFANVQEKEAYLKGLRDGDRTGNCQIVDNLSEKLYIWWQAQPKHIRRIFSVYPSYNESWTVLDLHTRLNIYNYCLIKEYPLPIDEGEERSMLIEIVCVLASLALEFTNGKTHDAMCKDEKYLPKYQKQFNRLYDDIEALIMNHDFILPPIQQGNKYLPLYEQSECQKAAGF